MASKPRRNSNTDKALLERDMRDINNKLASIDVSIKVIEARDSKITTLEFKSIELEKRIEKIESYANAVIKIVMGTVGVAILALVIGVNRT